jgi:hypothetical protein
MAGSLMRRRGAARNASAGVCCAAPELGARCLFVNHVTAAGGLGVSGRLGAGSTELDTAGPKYGKGLLEEPRWQASMSPSLCSRLNDSCAGEAQASGSPPSAGARN